MATEAEELKLLRTHRSHVRAAIEQAAEAHGMNGYVSAWVAITELTTIEDGEPQKCLFFSGGDYNDYDLAPWQITGMVDHAMSAMGCPGCDEEEDG